MTTLAKMAGQFFQGTDRAQFGRIHGWCYSLALLCAAESDDGAAILWVDSVMQADIRGRKARLTLLNSENPRVRKLVSLISEYELSLYGSADEPAGHSTERATYLRDALARLYEELQGTDADQEEGAMAAGENPMTGEMARLGDLLLSNELREALLASHVARLQLAGDRRTFPLGACLVDGKRIDALTVIERAPEMHSAAVGDAA